MNKAQKQQDKGFLFAIVIWISIVVFMILNHVVYLSGEFLISLLLAVIIIASSLIYYFSIKNNKVSIKTNSKIFITLSIILFIVILALCVWMGGIVLSASIKDRGVIFGFALIALCEKIIPIISAAISFLIIGLKFRKISK